MVYLQINLSKCKKRYHKSLYRRLYRHTIPAQSSSSSSSSSKRLVFSAFALRTAPGLGYGLCWNRGPAAVVSAPVFASFRLGRPVDHEPLKATDYVLYYTNYLFYRLMYTQFECMALWSLFTKHFGNLVGIQCRAPLVTISFDKSIVRYTKLKDPLYNSSL